MRQTDAQQFTCFSSLEIYDTLLLFGAQTIVINGLHRLVPSGVIIARVIFPTQCGLIRELLLFDEVDFAQF